MMWPHTRNHEEELKGYKNLVVNKMRFKIRRLNPLIDFSSDKIPQIFTDFHSHRQSNGEVHHVERIKKIQRDMYDVIEAGVVEPELVGVGKKGGISAEDLFREPGLGTQLYYEILFHSLQRFRGLKRLFFWTGTRFTLSMLYASGIVNSLRVSSSPPKRSP